MAYSIGKTSALQTAIKAAVDIALAEYTVAAEAGNPLPSILDRVSEVKDLLTPELFAQVDADNAVIAAQPSRSYSGGGNSGGGGGSVSLQDAKDMVLNFGQFKGMTLENVAAMTPDEVDAYTNGKRSTAGIAYIKWLSGNKDPKARFAATRAKLVLDDYIQTGQDLTALGA